MAKNRSVIKKTSPVKLIILILLVIVLVLAVNLARRSQENRSKAAGDIYPTPTSVLGASCWYSSDSTRHLVSGEKVCLSSNGSCAMCLNGKIISSTGCSACKEKKGSIQDKVIGCENAYSKIECLCLDNNNITRNHGASWCSNDSLYKCVVGKISKTPCGTAGCNSTTKTCNSKS